MSLLLLALAGCAPGPYGAPQDSTLTLTSSADADLVVDAGTIEPGDGYGALFRFLAYVLIPDGRDANAQDIPGVNIRVDVTSGWSGAYLVPESAVAVVDDYQETCNSSGGTEDPENPCSAWFDTANQQYIEFSGEYEAVSEFQPTYLTGGTDNRGYFEFFVFIDSVPVSSEDGGVIPFAIYADIGVESASSTFSFE